MYNVERSLKCIGQVSELFKYFSYMHLAAVGQEWKKSERFLLQYHGDTPLQLP